ncbi:MAG: nuclear transport factor 2 family protein [Cystobacter sp.]
MKSEQPEKGPSAAVQLFRSGFQALLRQDVEGFVDMWAEDGSLEFPYQLPGGVERLEGKAAIRAHALNLRHVLFFERLSEPVFHETADQSVLIAEFTCEGTAVATGRPYPQRYISVIELRGGKIFRYRDYWNPLIAQQATGLGGRE